MTASSKLIIASFIIVVSLVTAYLLMNKSPNPNPESTPEAQVQTPTSAPVVAENIKESSAPAVEEVKPSVSSSPVTTPVLQKSLPRSRQKVNNSVASPKKQLRKKNTTRLTDEISSPESSLENATPEVEVPAETTAAVEELASASSKYTLAVGGNLVLQKFKLESATDNVNIPNVTSLNLLAEFYYHHNSKHTYFAAGNFNPVKMDVNYDNASYSPKYKRSQLDLGYLYSYSPSWSLGAILNYQSSSFLYPSISDLTTLEYSTLRPYLKLGYKLIGLGNHGISAGLAVAPYSLITSKEARVKSLKSPMVYRFDAEYAYGLTANTKISLFGSYHIENLKFNYSDAAFTESGIDFKTQYFDVGAKFYYDF